MRTIRPPILAHHISRLDIAMDEADAVHRRQRAAQLLSDLRRFLVAEGDVRREQIFERASFDELHPDADAAFRGFRSIDPDDIGDGEAWPVTALR